MELDGFRMQGRKEVRKGVKQFMDAYVELHPDAYRKRVKYLSNEQI